MELEGGIALEEVPVTSCNGEGAPSPSFGLFTTHCGSTSYKADPSVLPSPKKRKIGAIPTHYCHPPVASSIAKNGDGDEGATCSSGNEEADNACEVAESTELPLPDELLSLIMDRLEPRDLAKVAAVNRNLREIATCNQRWRPLFAQRFGEPTVLTDIAAVMNGGWNRLYGAKVEREALSSPWQTPVESEIDALMADMRPNYEDGLEIIFLVDGSGSVSDEDFAAITSFLRSASKLLLDDEEIEVEGVHCHAAIIQFSNEVRVERQLQKTNRNQFLDVVGKLERINGGTNISAPIAEAGRMLYASRSGGYNHVKPNHEDMSPSTPEREQPASDCVKRVVVILSDGRVDSFQSREAINSAKRMAEQLPNLSVHALGVGRGVDSQEMKRLIAAGNSTQADCVTERRYLGLRTLEDEAW